MRRSYVNKAHAPGQYSFLKEVCIFSEFVSFDNDLGVPKDLNSYDKATGTPIEGNANFPFGFWDKCNWVESTVG